ncbi:hatching enzyme 1.2-like [Lucilia cuprina]|uniref:hatching enzyme 1.2-like n=1 Tax=Lucilia cuprina TaxID=7375 RepID=UPI001F06BFE1|nr:hatching enzyme 1.2-like [Lucilia cuprina]
MFNFLAILLFLVVGKVCSVPLIPQIGDEEEMVEVFANTLTNEAPHLKDVIDLSFYGSAIYGDPDDQHTAQMVANYTPEAFDVNPEELGTYLEGDILIPKKKITTKNGLTSQSSRWPKGIVPYEIRGNFNARDMSIIEHAIREYHRRTCIRFVPRSNEQDYVSIVSGNSGCWSSVGRVGGKQEVNLQSPGCLTKPGTAIHELMHALGFLHEQNREERDSYVSIQYQNIQPSAMSNFDRAAKTVAFGIPYDYGSVMHYSANAFSTNGRPTIVPMQNMGRARMGQRDGFSAFDVEKLNKMYDCGYGGVSAPAPTPAPIPAPVPIPAPNPLPAPGGQGIDNSIVTSFVSGLLSGLGLGDDPLS